MTGAVPHESVVAEAAQLVGFCFVPRDGSARAICQANEAMAETTARAERFLRRQAAERDAFAEGELRKWTATAGRGSGGVGSDRSASARRPGRPG